MGLSSGWDTSQVGHGSLNLRAESFKRSDLCKFIKECTMRIRLSRWYAALELVEEMLRGRILPDVITYSAAISACEKGQQPQQALQLLNQMQHRGLLADITEFAARDLLTLLECRRSGS